jgi:hypothetical protein
MGMIACFQMVDDQSLKHLFQMDEDDLFEEIEELQEDSDSVLDIDKLWDGLHFLLTGVSACQPIEGNHLSEAIIGTSRFSDDVDSEFITYSFPEEVVEISNALENFDIEKAIGGFNPEEYDRNEIYPSIWMEEDKESLQEELSDCFNELKSFYEKAVEAKKGIVVSIY